MNLELLRQRLREAAPPTEAMMSLGISKAEAEKFTSSFELVPRSVAEANTVPPGPMHDFFSLYDPSPLEIGMVRFLPTPDRVSSGWVIGQAEADPLLLDEASNEIVVSDLTAPGRVLWRCADRGEHFLLALVPAAQYLGRCLIDDVSLDQKSLEDALAQCVMSAGGASYEPFYRMLLGCE